MLVKDKTSLLLDTFDSLAMPVFALDRGGHILSFNRTVASILEYADFDLIGRNIGGILSAKSPAGDGAWAVSSGDEPMAKDVHFEADCRKKNGEIFAARVALITDPSADVRLVVIKDLSDQRRLQQRASRRAKELSVFNTLASILTGRMDTRSIMNETIDMVLSATTADVGWIYLKSDESGALLLSAQRGMEEKCVETMRVLAPGECFSGKVFSSGRPLLVKRASDDPRVTHRELGMESMIGVPVASRGILMGVLGVAGRNASHFSAPDSQLLATIGSLLGVAIENSRLIGELQEKMKQIELINELSGIINSSLSIGTVFRIMVAEIRKLIGYSRASLLLYNEKDDNLLIFALDTEMKTLMKKGVTAPIEGTSAGWVIRNNKPWITFDLSDAVFPLDRKLFDEGIRSTVSIPLIHDKILGVFNLDSTEVSKYSERDLQILLPAAKHISIALENALLFEEISREKKEWEKTFDAITDMVWIEDGRQRVIRANRTLLEKTGFSSVESSGKACWDILDRVGISLSDCCLCSETITHRRPSFRELKGTGASIFHFWAYPLLDEEGRLYAIVHYLKDVTAQKRLEQQLIRSNRLASLGTLAAGIAHEINNPLGIIAGYSEALIDRSQDESLKTLPPFEDFPEYLETIHKEIFRCKDILKGLLDFARPSCGTFREIDINELIKEVILLVNHKARRLDHNIELRLNRDLPKIFADPGSLRQLFLNIIINSLYYTPEKGSIIIRTGMDLEDRDPQFAGNHSDIRVTISDTGEGIPAAALDKVFDPFFTTKPVGDGTGLGLAICHKIVEEHGGSIDAESEEGKGTTFIIRLPENARDDKNTGS